MVSERMQNILLAAMGALAVGASAFAMWSVNRPHPSLEVPQEVRVADGDEARQTMGATSTTAQAEDDNAVHTEPPTAEVTSPPAEAELDDWLAAVDGPADLLVIGDGYSNLPSHWLQQWGALLADDRKVVIRHWGEAADTSFNDPITLGTAKRNQLEIWSASRAGSSIDDAVQRLDRFLGDADGPEAVLITLGGSSGSEDVSAALDDLLEALPDVPVLLSVGPADYYAPGVGEDMATWGAKNAEQVVTVDLRDQTQGAPNAEQWARAFQSSLEE